jgi:hypothetical protein
MVDNLIKPPIASNIHTDTFHKADMEAFGSVARESQSTLYGGGKEKIDESCLTVLSRL